MATPETTPQIIDAKFKELIDAELDTQKAHAVLVRMFGIVPVMAYYEWRADETQKIVDEIEDETEDFGALY